MKQRTKAQTAASTIRLRATTSLSLTIDIRPPPAPVTGTEKGPACAGPKRSKLFDSVADGPSVAGGFGGIEREVQHLARRKTLAVELRRDLLRPPGQSLGPGLADFGGKLLDVGHTLQVLDMLGVFGLVDDAGLFLEVLGDFDHDLLDLGRQAVPGVEIDRQPMPGDRAETDQGVVGRGLIELCVDPGAREHDPALVNMGAHVLIGLGQRALNADDLGIFQPVQIEAGAGNLLPLQIGQIVPIESGAEIVGTVGDDGEELLVDLSSKTVVM